MSRFLIRPRVNCKNLASKGLGISMATIAKDFDQQYGYPPLLIESFVDTEYYSGTCYRAANWLEIGKTKGRGRQDRHNHSPLNQKSLYLYPLDSSFRKQLGLSANAGLGALSISEGLDAAQWAEHEFGGTPLGDKRLSKRLVNVAHAKTQGLNLYATFAIAPDGLPLGVLKAQCIAPQSRSSDDKRKPSALPIEEKSPSSG